MGTFLNTLLDKSVSRGPAPVELSIPFNQNISVFRNSEKAYKRIRPASFRRGVSRTSHTLDAGCGGRGCAEDERRYSRTAKACGPGAPTLAPSLDGRSKGFREATVANKHWLTEESAQ
jgi:hypothetical protein